MFWKFGRSQFGAATGLQCWGIDWAARKLRIVAGFNIQDVVANRISNETTRAVITTLCNIFAAFLIVLANLLRYIDNRVFDPLPNSTPDYETAHPICRIDRRFISPCSRREFKLPAGCLSPDRGKSLPDFATTTPP